MSLKLTIKDEVGIITIDREKSLNALNKQVLKEILKTLNKFIKSKDIKVICITGSGDKAFIAGADIKEMSKEGFNISKVNNSSELCNKSNLIVTTTSANQSLISKSDIMPGTHITAVGSDTPEKSELDPAILGISHCIVVDSISQCRERGETKYALDDKIIEENDLIELGTVIESGRKARIEQDEITVADLTGVAVQDIMITNAVYNKLNNK